MYRFKTASLTLLFSFVALLGTVAPSQAANPNDAVTVWWVVFNNPEQCATSPCGEPDFENPEVEASVVYASGGITHAGKLDLATSLYATGADFIGLDGNVSLIGGPGLADSHNAEIHVVVRSHGEAINGQLVDQITQFVDPNCSEVGGTNECIDVQFAIFQPGVDETDSGLFRFSDGSQVAGGWSRLIRYDGGVQLLLRTTLDD